MNKNFGLTPKQFDRLVGDLKRNETFFFERVFLTHFKDCIAYLKRECGASQDDAYDATMDTMLEFRKRLVEGKLSYGNLRFLFTRMASQTYFRNRKAFQLQDMEEEEPEMDELVDNEEELMILNEAWKELDVSSQNLLKWHYYGKMKMAEIAMQEGKSAAAIRKQKERALKRLREIINTKLQAHTDEKPT